MKWLPAILLLLTACSFDLNYECLSNDDCTPGTCVSGVCESPTLIGSLPDVGFSDTGTDTNDVHTDADTGMDTDTGIPTPSGDAGSDAETPDADVDADMDAVAMDSDPTDVGPDVPSDIGVDATADTEVDTWMDADVTPDADVDLLCEPGTFRCELTFDEDQLIEYRTDQCSEYGLEETSFFCVTGTTHAPNPSDPCLLCWEVLMASR